MKADEFEEWFIGLYGPRPSPLDVRHLREAVETHRRILAHEEAILVALEEWEARYAGALAAKGRGVF